MTIKGHSPKTIEAYYIDLRFFLRFLHSQRNNISSDQKNLDDIPFATMSEKEILSATIADAYSFLHFAMHLTKLPPLR